MEHVIKNFTFKIKKFITNRDSTYFIHAVHNTLPINFTRKLHLLDRNDEYAFDHLIKEMYNLIYDAALNYKEDLPIEQNINGIIKLLYTPVYDTDKNKWYVLLENKQRKYEP